MILHRGQVTDVGENSVLHAGLDHLKATLDKKVLIVVSGGGDKASHHTLTQVSDASGRSDSIIYTIGLFDENDEDSNPGVLKRIARATVETFSCPRKPSAVAEIWERIATCHKDDELAAGGTMSWPKSDSEEAGTSGNTRQKALD